MKQEALDFLYRAVSSLQGVEISGYWFFVLGVWFCVLVYRISERINAKNTSQSLEYADDEGWIRITDSALSKPPIGVEFIAWCKPDGDYEEGRYLCTLEKGEAPDPSITHWKKLNQSKPTT